MHEIICEISLLTTILNDHALVLLLFLIYPKINVSNIEK